MESKRYLDDLAVTELLYLDDTYRSSAEAKVVGIEQNDKDKSKWALILDQTVFYPQGGGQPYDTGFVRWMSEEGVQSELQVEAVFLGREDSLVRHWVTLVPPMVLPELGVAVSMEVDMSRRILNSNYHTAGHLVDLAVATMDSSLKPEGLDRAFKGDHTPGSAYVKFEDVVDFSGDLVKENFINGVNARLDELRAESLGVVSRVLEAVEGAPEGKVYREVRFEGYEEYKVGCGGTHVVSTSELPRVVVDAVRSRSRKGTTIKYSVEG